MGLNERGRKPLHASVRKARDDLRDLLEAEMTAGYRARGDCALWTKAALYRELDVQPETGKDWFRPDPAPPKRFARKILALLYGDRAEYAQRRASMRSLMLAAGVEADELDDAVQIDLHEMKRSAFNLEAPELVRFSIYQPMRANDSPRLLVPFELAILRDDTKRAPMKNTNIKAKLEIGVTEARFVVTSTDWRPSRDSIFGPAGPELHASDLKVSRNGSAGTLIIKSATQNDIVEGEPFEHVHVIPMEPVHVGGDGPISFQVKAHEDDIVIKVPGGSELAAEAKADLQRILLSKLVPRESSVWFVLAEETVSPTSAASHSQPTDREVKND